MASLSRKPKADEDADNSGLPSGFPVGYAPEQPPEILETGQGSNGSSPCQRRTENAEFLRGNRTTGWMRNLNWQRRKSYPACIRTWTGAGKISNTGSSILRARAKRS